MVPLSFATTWKRKRTNRENAQNGSTTGVLGLTAGNQEMVTTRREPSHMIGVARQPEDGRLLDANIGLSQHGSFVVCKNLEAKEEEIGTCAEKWIDNRCARTKGWKPGDGDDKKGDLPYDWCCKAEETGRMQFKKKKSKTIIDKVIIRNKSSEEKECIGCSVKYGGLYLPLNTTKDMVITDYEKIEKTELDQPELAEQWEAHAVIRCADRLTDNGKLTDRENDNSEKYEYMYYRLPRPFNPADVNIAKMVGKCEKWGVKEKTCD